MQMKVAGVGHLYSGRMTCGYQGTERPRAEPCKRAAPGRSIFVHISGAGQFEMPRIRTGHGIVEARLGTEWEKALKPSKYAGSAVDDHEPENVRF